MATTAIPPKKRRVSIIARVLAPLALAAAVIAVLIVVSGSTPSSEESSHRHHAKGGNDKPDQSQPADQDENQDTYVVQAGDTLDGIAQENGVSVAKLQELNENVDTQALVPGSTLKLH
jgi:LysM repeat protein